MKLLPFASCAAEVISDGEDINATDKSPRRIVDVASWCEIDARSLTRFIQKSTRFFAPCRAPLGYCIQRNLVLPREKLKIPARRPFFSSIYQAHGAVETARAAECNLEQFEEYRTISSPHFCRFNVFVRPPRRSEAPAVIIIFLNALVQSNF